jgi:hypothetical protein
MVHDDHDHGPVGGALIQAVKGTTDPNGNLCLDWPKPFSGTPVVSLTLQTTLPEVHSARITAVSATGASVHVARLPVSGGPPVSAYGVEVHTIAVGAP